MRTAYLDCFSGVSGDMLLGALLDVGLPEAVLHEAVAALQLDGVTLEISRPVVQGFAATRVQVHVPCHDHDHHHIHRHLAEITALLDRAGLNPKVRARALAVFTRLAEAEAVVHGTTPDRIHFHEVGADDALVDIVGTVAGLAWLGVERLVCSPLPLTGGWVACAHGEVPCPRRRSAGAARGCAGVRRRSPPGTGHAHRRRPGARTGRRLRSAAAPADGAHRLWRGVEGTKRWPPQPAAAAARSVAGVAEAQRVEVLETHLDDWNPEFWPYLSDRLMASRRPGCLPGAHAHEKDGPATCCGC